MAHSDGDGERSACSPVKCNQAGSGWEGVAEELPRELPKALALKTQECAPRLIRLEWITDRNERRYWYCR